MSTLTTPATTWQWPSDVLAFAQQQNLAHMLDPLLQATRQLFPTIQSLKVHLKLDPEIRDDWYIFFEVRVPKADVPDFIAAVNSWSNELERIYPYPRTCVFRLFLTRVPA